MDPNLSDHYDEDDLEAFISELQRIIEESPPGMQARFARIINYLRQKKRIVRAIDTSEGEIDPNILYKNLLEKVEEDIELISRDGEKFENLLNLAKIRELISAYKRRKYRFTSPNNSEDNGNDSDNAGSSSENEHGDSIEKSDTIRNSETEEAESEKEPGVILFSDNMEDKVPDDE